MLLLISAYADGEATPDEVERAVEHLAGCTSCRKMVEQWQGHQQLFTWAYTREITDGCTADELIRQAGREESMTEDAMPRKVAQERKPIITLPRRWAWAAATAAIFMLLLIAYQFISPLLFLKIGREVVTAASPRAARMAFNIDLTVGPNSIIRRIDKRTIRLERGWVAATVSGDASITIATPRITVTDRGTKFHVGIGTKAEYVAVKEGSVDALIDGETHTVSAGQALLVGGHGTLAVLDIPAKKLETIGNGITKEQAMTIAEKISGISLSKNVTVQLETLAEGDDIPFLSLTGTPVWRVSVKNFELFIMLPPEGKGYTKPDHQEIGGRKTLNVKITEIDIIISRDTGQLIKITSPVPTERNASLIHNRESDEQDLHASSEIYVGLPADLPDISFMQAIQAMQEQLGGPLVAPQVEAYYVMKKEPHKNESAFRRWMITLRYLPVPKGLMRHPHGYKGERKLPEFLNIRHEIDPVSGDWIGAGNIPDGPV
jgi:hypothetical protein